MINVIEKYRLTNHPELGSDSSYGNNGFFIIPHHRITDYEYRVQVSDGEWEHVSITVAPHNKKATRCPTWEEMCYIKELFWEPEDVVIQFHPKKSEYINMHPFCLHLWRSIDQVIPTPPSIMVGF